MSNYTKFKNQMREKTWQCRDKNPKNQEILEALIHIFPLLGTWHKIAKKKFPHLSPECSIMLGMGNRLGGRGARCQIHIHNLLMSTILLTVNFTVIMFQQLL